MCGIAGYLGRAEFDPRPMLGALDHRGPDARGYWHTQTGEGRSLHLVHTRLKILDLSDAAAQPMIHRGPTGPRKPRQLSAERKSERWNSETDRAQHESRDGIGNSSSDNVLVFNGEIYNFRELRADLAAKGWTFSSSGDTEVLLKGYAEWGTDVFARCDGMFAVAIFDGPRHRLVLARDHAGIKPLYWARSADGGFVFASEVRAIAASRLVAREIDRDAVADFLRLGSFQEPATILSGIRAFPAASFAEISLDRPDADLSTTTFWSAERFAEESVQNQRSRGELLAAHRDALHAAVHDQLASDVPVGVFLSGGLDSTVLIEQMGKADRERLTAFTLGGAATNHDEAEIAARTSKNLGIRHTVVRPLASDLSQWVADGLAAMDQPSCDGINTYLVSRASRSAGLVAVLSGCGADELHGAYGHATSLARFIRAFSAAGPFRDVGGRIAATLLSARQGRIAGERLRLMVAAVPDVTQVVEEKRRFFTPSEIDALCASISEASPAFAQQSREMGPNSDLRSQITIAELNGYLRNTLLRDCDWATMANHQELRVPYLDRRYMERVIGLPWSMKQPVNGASKPLLAGLVSAPNRELLDLPKRGFALNYGELLLRKMREPFHAACERLRADLGFAGDAGALLADHAALRSAKRANRLWGLLALGHYCASLRA